MATRTIGTGETTPWDPLTNRKNKKKIHLVVQGVSGEGNLQIYHSSSLYMRHERTRWKDQIHLLVARWLTIPLVEESAAFLKCPPVSNCQTQLHQIESKCKATVYGPSVSIFGPSHSGASHTVGQSHWLVVQQSESVHVKRIAKKGIAHWDRCCSIHDFTHLLQLLLNFHLCHF